MAEKPNPLGRWRPVSQRHEINTPWLGVRNVTYELPNGQTVENYYLVDKPPVVVVVPVRANKTFLIKEFERGVDQVGYKLPGGRIDAGEDAASAAGRELEEEVGIKARKLIHLGQSHVDPGLMPTTADYFLCDEFDDNPAGRVEDAKELFEGEWVELSTVGDRIASNEIKNPFVIVGYTLASSYLTKHRK